MIKPVKGVLLLLLGTALLSSCADESPWTGSSTEGGINLEFSADGRVIRQTRADDDGVSPVVPLAEQFCVNLRNSDGSYSKDWSGIESFNKENSFPIGDYTLTASFGDINVQGFELPYFMGQASVQVAPNSETTVGIVATLANSMVSVRYSNAFVENFTKYSASVQSEGHDWVVFAQNEDRPAYIAPGNDVKLNLTLTDTEGREVTIQPATFTARPKTHYVITVDVDGSTGTLVLNVVFEENVVNETVEVSLDDDLFTAEPPVVKTSGLVAGSVIEGFVGLTKIDRAEFQVFTFGGLSKTNLNFETDGSYTPAFGKSAQLVNASADVQAQLSREGIECIGFFNKPEKMGIIRIADFVNRLPAGSHIIEVQAVDALTRVSDPVKLIFNLQPVKFSFVSPQSVFFGATQVVVDINTNCPDVKDKFTFQAPDSNNKMVDVEVLEIEEVQPAGDLGYTYRYKLAVAPQYGSEVDVEATYGGSTISTVVPVVVPEYTLVPDAFAHHVLLKLSSTTNDPKQIAGNLKFYNNGSEISPKNISYDETSGIIRIVGLTPHATYDKMESQLGRVSKAVPSFTTELDAAVPNGNFSASSQTINLPNINVGGEFYISAVIKRTYTQLFTTIMRSTPNDWANLNQLTCFPGSNNQNTWYMVPSTWTENEQAVIQSVGYNHDGKEIPFSNNGVTTRYYCTNVPEEGDLVKSTGELFLGSYPFSANNEVRADGILWTSRPSSLSFEYKYTPQSEGEQGEAYISVLAANGQVLSSKTVYLDAQSNMTPVNIILPTYPFGQAAASIKIGFKSTRLGQVPAIYIPTGEELKEDGVNVGNYQGGAANNGHGRLEISDYKAYASGSKLIVDNVSLGYDFNSNASPAPKRKTSNKRR